MATITWKTAANGEWGTGTNWSTGTVPGSSDDAIIGVGGSYAVTLRSGQAAHSVTLAGSSATLDVVSTDTLGIFIGNTGTVQLESGVSLRINGATSFSQLNSYGPVITGAGTLVTVGATTLASQSAGYVDLYLAGGATWVNTGSVTVGGQIDIGVGPAQKAAFVNQAGGTFNFVTDYASIVPYTSYDTATFSNAGVITKTNGTGVSRFSPKLTNSGSIVVANGTLQFEGGGTFGGTLAGAGTIAFAGGTSTLNAGSVSISHVVVNGGDLVLTRGLGGTYVQTSGTLEVAGNDTISAAFAISSGTIILRSGGALRTNVTTSFGATNSYGPTITGPGTFTTVGTTTVATQTAGYVDMYIGGGATWLNASNATIGGQIDFGAGPAETATITNQAGAIFNLVTDYAGLYQYTSYDTATLSNAGILEKTGGTGISHIYAAVANTGSIVVTSGTIEFDGGGTFGGSVSGAGTVSFAGNAVAVLSATFNAASHVVLANGTIEVAASETIGAGFTATNGTIQLDAGTNLRLNGAASFDNTNAYGPLVTGPGTLTTAAATTLATQTTGYVDLYLAAGATWVNSGNATIGGQIDIGIAGAQTAAFVNQAGGIFNLITDYASIVPYTSYDTATFNNAGTLEKTGGSGTGVSHIYATVTNSGSIVAGNGTLEFDGGGTFGGTLAGAGTLAFGGGNSTLNAGSVSVSNVLVNGGDLLLTRSLGGTLTVKTGTLEVTGTDTISSAFAANAGTILLRAGSILRTNVTASFGATNTYGPVVTGAGTLLTVGTTTLATQTTTYPDMYLAGGATWLNASNATVGGQINIGVAGGQTATFINQGGAIFNFVTDLAGIVPYTSYDTATFTNGGLLEKTGGTGISHVYAAVTNTGSILVTSGTIEFDGGGTFGGSVSGAGTVAFAGNAIAVLNATFNAASHVVLANGTIEVTAAETIGAGFIGNNGTIQIDSGATLQLNGAASFGNTNTYGPVVSGPGTLVTTGTVTLATQTNTYPDLYVGGGGTWVNSGNATIGGMIYAGVAAADNAIFVNQAGGIFNLTTDLADIVPYTSYDTSTFSNAGLLEKTGGSGAGTSEITSLLTNSGTVLVSNGILKLSGGLTNFSGSTLTGGTYVANANSTLELPTNISITTIAAGITLNGTGSVIESLNTTSNTEVKIDSTLANIAATGRLSVLGGRGFTAVANGGTFSDAGVLTLGGGVFTANKLTVTAGATLIGNGAVHAPITLLGTLTASGGTLDTTGYSLSNLPGTTLTTGGLGANGNAVLQLATNKTITSTSGSITLNGTGSLIRSLNTGSNTQISVDSTLATVNAGGALNVLGGRSFTAVAASGTFTDNGLLSLGGGTFSATKLTIGSGGTLSGSGKVSSGTAVINLATVLANSGTLEFLGGVNNTGTMTATGATLKVDGALSGTGSVNVGASGTVALGAGSAASSQAKFLTNTGTLDLTAPLSFAGTISGFVLGDAIDLLNAPATSETFASGILTLKNGATTIANLHMAGSYTTSSFHIATDTHGGTLITHT